MKKIALYLLALSILIWGAACDRQDETPPPLTVDEIDIHFIITDADLLAMKYIEGYYTNHSQKTITGLTLTYEMNDGDTRTITSSDTVPPGENSPAFEGSAPINGVDDTLNIIAYTIIVADTAGTENTVIKYDVKKDRYQW